MASSDPLYPDALKEKQHRRALDEADSLAGRFNLLYW